MTQKVRDERTHDRTTIVIVFQMEKPKKYVFTREHPAGREAAHFFEKNYSCSLHGSKNIDSLREGSEGCFLIFFLLMLAFK